MNATVDRWFGLSKAGATPWGETRAGLTTFLTMAYILFVNPLILGDAIKIDGANMFGELLTATAVAAAIGSLVMGIWARHPFALAPGMGLNAYFTYTVVLQHGIAWPTALGAVFISGAIFFVLSVTGIRRAILRAIPREIRLATAAGIGLFLALIGLKNAGIVADDPNTLLRLGSLTAPSAWLAVLGIVLVGALLARRIAGAILVGIFAVTAIAIAFELPVYPGSQSFAGFDGGWVQTPVWPSHLFAQLDITGAIEIGGLGIVFIFLFVDLFDTAGTLMGLTEKSGATDDDGQLPRTSEAFAADAAATMAGAVLGTSTTTAYIESAAGIEAGGRTGLVAVVVAILFAASTCLWPLAGAVPAAATAPALIVIGAMMMSSLAKIDWANHATAIPAFLTIVGMPMTFSIANGISFGLIAWAAVELVSGRGRRSSWPVYVLASLLVARYVWLGVA